MMRESSETPIRADCCTSATAVCCFVILLEVSTSSYSATIAMATTITISTSIKVVPRCARSLSIRQPQIERLCRSPESGEGPLGGLDGHGHQLDGVCRGRVDSDELIGKGKCQVDHELLDGVGAEIGIDVPAVLPQRRANWERGRSTNRPGGRVIPRRKVIGESRRVRSSKDGEPCIVPGITGQLLEFLADERVGVAQLVGGGRGLDGRRQQRH